jgi:energy-coupling factor transport system ATP-binding protein
MIQIDGLHYRYPEHDDDCLRDVSLRLPAGSFSLVIGPSGGGKSTLLRCLNGLVPHFSGGVVAGSVRVNGLDPLALGPRVMSRTVGMVFQSPESQFVLDRVEDEIAFALEHVGLPRATMRLRVEETLDLLDLARLRDRDLSTLSGGERQRVAIAAVLALRPAVLVLDEPTSQLDPQSADEVLQALVRLNSDLGLTIVLAEHRIERVLPVVDQVIQLNGDGRAHAGPTRESMATSALCPPVVAVARRYAWQPLPLSVKEARPFAATMNLPRTTPAPAPKLPGRPYVEVQRLEAGYNGTAVLQGVDLNVWSGEIAVLMGRNGVGKSTLLRCMMGLLRPLRGDVRVAGRSSVGRDVAALSRQLACLPQEPDHMLFAETVADELRMTLRNHNQAPAPHAVAALLEQLGLSLSAERYPRDLSVGERQRAALGAVTITRPGGLLLDEPTRGLDYGAKAELATLLRRWRNEGTAILLVTHDVEFAADVADRVIILGRGGVVAEGAPAAVLSDSPLFAPQVARLFPGSGWLTAGDVGRAG